MILWFLITEISIWKILTLRTWCASRFEQNSMRPSPEKFFWPCLWTLKLASKFFRFHVPYCLLVLAYRTHTFEFISILSESKKLILQEKAGEERRERRKESTRIFKVTNNYCLLKSIFHGKVYQNFLWNTFFPGVTTGGFLLVIIYT